MRCGFCAMNAVPGVCSFKAFWAKWEDDFRISILQRPSPDKPQAK